MRISARFPTVPQAGPLSASTYSTLDSSQALRTARMNRSHQWAMERQRLELDRQRRIATALALALQAAGRTKR